MMHNWGSVSQRCYRLLALKDFVQPLRFLCRKSIVQFAILQVLATCCFHFSFLCISTPRYFAESTFCRVTLCILYDVFKGFVLLVMVRTLHLWGWNFMLLLFSHTWRLLRSSCKMNASHIELMNRCNRGRHHRQKASKMIGQQNIIDIYQEK